MTISSAGKYDSVKKRDRKALIDTFYDGVLPTDTLLTNAEFIALTSVGDEGADYAFYPSTYFWNQLKDLVADPTDMFAMQYDFNAATGTANGNLIIHIHGHESDDNNAVAADIATLKAAFPDYDILQCYMPGYDRQDAAVLYPRGYPQYWGELATHTNVVKSSPNLTFRHFTWPVIAAINHFQSSYDNIFLTGFSGGGMMALWAGAVDTRIAGTFPMAGFQPDAYRLSPDGSGAGDAEQESGPVYSKASRNGMCALAAENWCRCCWNTADTVIPLPAAEASAMQTAIQAVSPNFYTTTNVGAAEHAIQAAWLTAIKADMDALAGV